MEQDDDPAQDGAEDHKANSSRGIGRYLTRLKRVFRSPRDSNKVAKRSATATPGRSIAQKPFTSPEPLFPLQPDTTENSLFSKEPLERPQLPPPAASEGNLISCPPVVFNALPIRPPLCTDTVPANEDGIDSPNQPLQTPTFDLHTERAEKLFEKYGQPLEPGSFFYQDRPESRSGEQRVTKSIKLRVHHHCHRCGVAVGSSGLCINCGHKRCANCNQWPRRQQDNDRRMMRLPASSTRIETLDNWLSPKPITLSSTRAATSMFAGPRTLWSTRVVRRLCHHCHNPFIWTETVCQECHHNLCDECPRDPPRNACSTSQSSSSDSRLFERRERVLKRPRLRVKYDCESCGVQYDENETLCKGCGHIRCRTCPRFPPRFKSP